MWNKNNQAWRLPDPPDKGVGQPGAGASNGSASPQDSQDASFELDFSEAPASDPSAPRATPGAPENHPIPDSTQVSQQSTRQPDTSAEQFDGVFELPALEVGNPGDFRSQQYDHGVSLSDSAAQESALVAPVAVPEGLDALVMVDEPLPESMGGGSAAVQDMFVAEVLKGAQVAASSADLQPALGETVVYGASSDADKTIILPETKTEIELAAAQRTEAFPNPPSNTGLEATIATAVRPLAVQSQIEQPESPRVSDLLAQGSATIAKPEPKKATNNSETTKVGTSEKTKVGGTAKAQDAAAKDKPAGGGKKASPAAKAAQGEPKGGGAEQPQSQVASPTNTNPARLSFRQLPKDARIVLGTLVASVVIGVTLVGLKQFGRVTEKNITAAESVAPKQPDNITPSATSSAANTKSAKALQSADEDKEMEAAEAEAADELDRKDADAPAPKSAEEKKSETYFALTRPTSRYAMDVKALTPLFDASIALDRVQPRRVQNLLRQLPETYAATDPIEKNAIREITARYYLQVGALSKATILFSQACSDPAKTSDVEICLHAARGMLLSGNTQELRETIDLLRPRLTEKLAEWREWVNLLEISNQLSNPTLESFTQFTDEMIDKGPFMTSEWNLQLSGHFAKILMSVPHKLRIEYLKTLTGNRKKTFEMRLAPGQFGIDIGSYMLPSLLNLLLRYYELPVLMVQGEEPETDSEFSLMAWVFHVIAQANMNEPRQTRARLAPLFGEKSFSPLARIIEGHLAAQAGDYQGAAAMISEQIGLVFENVDPKAEELNKEIQGKRFLYATQRLREFPFLYVEWLFLGVKVASGLNDKELMKTVVLALEDARKRFPELKQEIQYWIMLGRGYRLLGYVAGVEASSKVTEQLASTPHEMGFVMADRIWVLMQKRKIAEARALMLKSLREIAYHSRLLELGAEFAAQWSEDPSSYLKLEQDIPKRYENRGRDRVLLSFFTIRKLLSNY